jgi:dTMP kinase
MQHNISITFSKFITFEGSEAVGKSTLIKKIADYFENHNIDYIITRDPGGTDIAEAVRTIIFHGTTKPSIMTELLLMFAARRDHIEKVIVPALNAHKIILCDRYIDSSYVYQSMIGMIPKSFIDTLVMQYIAPIYPNLCIIIDCDASIAYERIKKRGIENDNDNKSIEFLNQLRNAFLERPKINKNYAYYVVENKDLNQSVLQIINHFQTLKLI